MTKSQVLSKSSPQKGYKDYFKIRRPVYSAEYPNAQETKIVQLIIAQFEKLTQEERQAIISKRMQRVPLNIDGSQKKKKPTPDGTQLADSGNKSRPSSMKEMKHESQFKNIEQSYSSHVMQTPRSTQQIKKDPKTSKKTQYLKFYDFYYMKLHRQHPKWSSNQITTIIKLLWKKKIAGGKSRKSSISSEKSMRLMSGYELYKKVHQSIPTPANRQNWKRLPKESRNYYQNKGRQAEKKQRNIPKIFKEPIIREQAPNNMEQEASSRGLGFMSNKM